VSCPGWSTLDLWQLIMRQFRPRDSAKLPIRRIYPYTDQIVNAARTKKAPFRLGQRHFSSVFGLLQATQRITAITATIRARHPTNVRILRSLITGSLRIMFFTEMPHLVLRLCTPLAVQQSPA
jgi:hypothetical protein